MPAFLRNPNFWYVLCIFGIVLFAVFVIKDYLKKLSRGCCGAGGGEDIPKIRVSDRDKSHYPFMSVLTVDGMVCGNCAKRVENALNTLDGVWAKADPYTKLVTVRMKKPLEEQVLRDAVNHIGAYTVMTVTPK